LATRFETVLSHRQRAQLLPYRRDPVVALSTLGQRDDRGLRRTIRYRPDGYRCERPERVYPV